MNERDFQDRLYELGHSWQAGVAPAEEEAVSEAREEKHVRAIGDAIVRAAETQRRTRTTRRFMVALAAAVVASVLVFAGRKAFAPVPVALVVTPAANAPEAPLRGVRALAGQVTLRHGSGESVVQQASLSLGDELSIPEGSKAEVRLGGTVRADALGGSRLSVMTEGRAAHRLRIDTGRIEARVDDHPSDRPKLVVETPDADVVVTGTVFDVDVTRNASGGTVTRVSVEKGRVVILQKGVEVALVTSGSTWTSEVLAAGPAAAPPEPEPKPRHTLRTLAPGAPSVQRAPSSANLDDVRVGTLAEENAIFQAAIDARNRGDDATVVDRLGQLLVRYPATLLSGEARVERMRALSRLGRVEAAGREARRYLASFPEGFAREEAKNLVLKSAPASENSGTKP